MIATSISAQVIAGENVKRRYQPHGLDIRGLQALILADDLAWLFASFPVPFLILPASVFSL